MTPDIPVRPSNYVEPDASETIGATEEEDFLGETLPMGDVDESVDGDEDALIPLEDDEDKSAATAA